MANCDSDSGDRCRGSDLTLPPLNEDVPSLPAAVMPGIALPCRVYLTDSSQQSTGTFFADMVTEVPSHDPSTSVQTESVVGIASDVADVGHPVLAAVFQASQHGPTYDSDLVAFFQFPWVGIVAHTACLSGLKMRSPWSWALMSAIISCHSSWLWSLSNCTWL